MFSKLLFLCVGVFSHTFYETLRPIYSDKSNIESNFYIALLQNNTEFLTNQLLDISNPYSKNYGRYYNKDIIRELITPLESYRTPVLNWLSDSNLSVGYDYGDSLYVTGSLNAIEQAFLVDMQQFTRNKNTLYRSNVPYTIPKHLQPYIVFIEGISNPIYKKNLVYQISKSRSHIEVDDRFAGKEALYRKYRIKDDMAKHYTSSICSIEYQGGSGFSETDLQLNQQLNSHSISNITNIVGNDYGADMESQLDMQMMGNQIFNKTDIWFWDDNNWLYSLGVNMSNTYVIPDIISMSWGWREDAQCSITNCTNETSAIYIERVNMEYVKLGLRGVSIVTASGDAGAPGRTNENCNNKSKVNAVYPGASPWVTSVGGTFIVKDNETRKWTTTMCADNDCFTGNEERVTNFNYTGWTSGGGFSKYTNRSTYGWQVKAVDDYLSSNIPLPNDFARHGRAYPDVSIIGHSCPVVMNGNIDGVDGTSCSSPLFATVLSILNEHQLARGRNKIGFASPLLYAMYYSNYSIFNDVTEGNNYCTEGMCCDTRSNGGSDYGYMAGFGYDPVYGLGTPNVERMKDWLDLFT